MKKTIIKFSVSLLVFIAALVIINKQMNVDHNNMTVEIAEATLPVITMDKEGVAYNRLTGYTNAMEPAFQRDRVTVLGEGRKLAFDIATYGREVKDIRLELRSMQGTRLIENTKIDDFEEKNGRIHVSCALKDLMEKNKEYSLTIFLTLDNDETVRFYTVAIWGDGLHTEEIFDFVLDFHNRLYDRESARELTRYLESNSALESNTSFHKVNIHSSFKQITWGDLEVTETVKPVICLKDIEQQTASLLVDYGVSAPSASGKGTSEYKVQEYFRVRFTPDRMYLLDYERTMDQIPAIDSMYGNDKITLGITGSDVPMTETEDGNVLVFEAADRLCSYNLAANKLAVLFAFADEKNNDERSTCDDHGMKILDVDEDGNVNFAVYGYMNRGRHEGEVGIELYRYDAALNTIEEIVYIPYDKSFAVLNVQMQKLLYLNREGRLYLYLESSVYKVDLADKSTEKLFTVVDDANFMVSADHKIMAWQDREDSGRSVLRILNVDTEVWAIVRAFSDETIYPLGFMGDDVVYGTAKDEDITDDVMGDSVPPLYKLTICGDNGKEVKEYRRENTYITSCTIDEGQITMKRAAKGADGRFNATVEDHIMNNVEKKTGKNHVVTSSIDVYEQYVQIRVKNPIDLKNLKILTPKELVFEGGRTLELDKDEETNKYYAFGPYGVNGIYTQPAPAVKEAARVSGVVVNSEGSIVWKKKNRVAKNQILAIKADEDMKTKNSLAVCLDEMLKHRGIVRNSQYLLEQGQTAEEILAQTSDWEVLDLSGCSLDSLLYYVNMDYPILVPLKNDEAVLIVGFNEYNSVIFDPVEGSIYKKGLNDTAAWLEENAKGAVTYIIKE